MKRSLIAALLILLTNCLFAQGKYTKYVDPFIGTGGHGHTYPGALVPHGMVQLSPDTRLDGWDGCSGYHYSDNYIYGFTHTHLSGTGCSDYGDILLMPMTGNPTPDNKKYGSHFSHANEKASPGYYSVKLEDNNIFAELTATTRVGFHRYTFPQGAKASVILDLKHRDDVLENSINIEDSVTISGLRRSRAWASNQYVYFVIKFSKPMRDYGVYINDTLHKGAPVTFVTSSGGNRIANQIIKAYFSFNNKDGRPLLTKVALSLVSVEGARKNLQAELPGWDFDKVKTDAAKEWDKELGRIEATSDSLPMLRTFYTALYHTMVAPNVSSDVDGQYRGRDNKIHTANGFTYYTVFSLWDTYRGAHPLYTIIDRKRTLDYIKTFLAEYKDGGRLPVWELSSNETDCMIGYHSVPVIVDAYAKGINQFDKALALEAMEKSANWNHYGLTALIEHGYLEAGDENESVSKTLEYAYDDWCIAKFAKMIGKEDDYKVYIRRAQNYKNVLDINSGFMRPKVNGNWLSPFDPRQVDNNFTEANSWQYSFYVPQDINGYLTMLGGKERLERKLDSLFTETTQTTGREQDDISGQIGQYAHGNEPSHHIIYLYNFAGKPYKTQERVHQVLQTLYRDKPDGLEGNEDCGQMSAWYVLSALGFYPVTPGTTDFMIGTPVFNKAIIHTENGKAFTITAPGVSGRNYYIKSTTLNGKSLSTSSLSYNDILKGGSISFAMANSRVSDERMNTPLTSIDDNLIVLNPVIDGGDMSYTGSKKVAISSPQKNVTIYYTLDKRDPTKQSTVYTYPFDISASVTVKAIAVNANGEESKVTKALYHKRTQNWKITLNTPYEQEFPAGGNEALIDELRGTTDWRKGGWQGYQKNDVDVTIDLGKDTLVSKISAGFLQDTRAWIIAPKQLIIEVSSDGTNYRQIYSGTDFLPIEDLKVQVKKVIATFNPVYTRFLHIKALQYGKLPAWHESAGSDSHIFIDEIVVD